MDERLVPIGRFAEMTRLSIRTLRHYHDRGLLQPAVVDDQTGYRYYRLGQANRAEAISVLRRVDMPLDEIAAVLDGTDGPDHARTQLHAHRRRLADALRRHEQMLDFLDGLLAGEQTLLPYDITLEHVPDRTIASVRVYTDFDTMSSRLADALARISEYLDDAGRAPCGPPLVVFHDIVDVDQPGEIAVGVPCDGDCPPATQDVAGARLPGGQATVTTHQGPYSRIAPAYHALTDWMVSRGLQTGGPPREIYLDDPSQVDEENLLTRVEWPLR